MFLNSLTRFDGTFAPAASRQAEEGGLVGGVGPGVGQGRGPGLDANIEVDDPTDHDGAQSDDISLQAEVEHVLNVAPGLDAVVRLEGAAHGFADLQ